MSLQDLARLGTETTKAGLGPELIGKPGEYERVKKFIERYQAEFGYTPEEDYNLLYASEVESRAWRHPNDLNDEYEGLTVFELDYGAELGIEEGRMRRLNDLLENFLWKEAEAAFFAGDEFDPRIVFQAIAGRAIVRLLTEWDDGIELFQGLMEDEDCSAFLRWDEEEERFVPTDEVLAMKHHPIVEDRDNYSGYVQTLYDTLPNSDTAVRRLILAYCKTVRKVWGLFQWTEQTYLPDEDYREEGIDHILNGGGYREAERISGVSRRTLKRQIEKLGLSKKG